MMLGVVNTCNPSAQETETERLRVLGQPGLHSEILCSTYNQTERRQA